MAVFCLLYSVMWKKWDNKKLKLYLFNILALIIALITILFRSRFTYLILNFILLMFIIFTLFKAYTNSRNNEKAKNLYITYFILSIFWVLNIINILIPKFLELFQLIIYLASTLLFMIILYRVLRNIGN